MSCWFHYLFAYVHLTEASCTRHVDVINCLTVSVLCHILSVSQQKSRIGALFSFHWLFGTLFALGDALSL